ncbi:hypothetical protein GRF29_19g110173 [Pseudopithomyces chartarum]|uniref:NTF2-like domain-containing protein n=1 Tax=Pseudopithomyces chartarum TaxID=1892770 RepID=A0AAN6RJ78_9PLEO|nr:hypothetical protein GRF29_19g110173 [Pseudopithomyces chartarum]
MRVAFFAVLSVACSTAAAHCLTDTSARRVAENFRSTVADYSPELADRVFSVNFTDYADGVNELMNNGCPNGPKPLGSPTFSSLEEFKNAQSGQPPIPFEILKVWNNCETVFLRWRSSQPGFVEPAQQVTGIIVLETSYAGGEEPYIIDTVYSEFNSGAWLSIKSVSMAESFKFMSLPKELRLMIYEYLAYNIKHLVLYTGQRQPHYCQEPGSDPVAESLGMIALSIPHIPGLPLLSVSHTIRSESRPILTSSLRTLTRTPLAS